MSWTKQLLNLLIVFASIIFGLSISELALRVFYPQNLSGSWRVMHPSGLMINKTGGHSRHQLKDIVVEYSFSKFHNRQIDDEVKYENQKRILILGDSFTFGWLIANGSTYADKLQVILKNHTLINSAAGGWGTADHSKFIELFCPEIKPSEIFIFLNVWDVHRAQGSSLYKLDKNGDISNNEPVRKNRLKAFLNDLPIYQWLLEHSHLLSLARTVYLYEKNPVQPNSNQLDAIEKSFESKTLGVAIALEERLFKKIKKDANSCGASVRVFYTGWKNIYDKKGNEDPTMLFLRKAKKEEFFSKNGITFHDLGESGYMRQFQGNRSKYSIPDDGHPNNLGAENIFQAIIEALNNNDFLK